MQAELPASRCASGNLQPTAPVSPIRLLLRLFRQFLKPTLEAREPQVLVDILTAHVSEGEVFESVGVVLDDSLPDLLGGLREVTGVAESVTQLPKRLRLSKLGELDVLRR